MLTRIIRGSMAIVPGHFLLLLTFDFSA